MADVKEGVGGEAAGKDVPPVAAAAASAMAAVSAEEAAVAIGVVATVESRHPYATLVGLPGDAAGAAVQPAAPPLGVPA